MSVHRSRSFSAVTTVACCTSVPTAAHAEVFTMPSGQTSVQMVTIGEVGREDCGGADDREAPAPPANLGYGCASGLRIACIGMAVLWLPDGAAAKSKVQNPP